MIEIEKVAGKCKENLDKGRAVATGIGVFAALMKDGKILLRVRQEKGSSYNQDLSGKWELVGGGVEVNDFEEAYWSAVFHTLKRELAEEAGLAINSLSTLTPMLPAWLCKNNLIDLAFVMPIPWKSVWETDDFTKKLVVGELKFFGAEEIEKIEFVSPRMKFLAERALAFVGEKNLWGRDK